jgi:hypothetical protein
VIARQDVLYSVYQVHRNAATTRIVSEAITYFR